MLDQSIGNSVVGTTIRKLMAEKQTRALTPSEDNLINSIAKLMAEGGSMLQINAAYLKYTCDFAREKQTRNAPAPYYNSPHQPRGKFHPRARR